MQLGIDKVSCITQEFRIDDMATFDHTPTNEPKIKNGAEIQPRLLTTINGQPIKSHTNALKIMGQGTEQVVGVSILPAKVDNAVNGNLCITFNPSKIAYGGYELLQSPDILGDVFSHISQMLTEAGIHTNLENAKVQRVDLTKQAEMPRMARDYIPAYDLMQVKYGRDIKRILVEDDYLRLQNGSRSQWQLCAYDKQKAYLSMAETPAEIKKLGGRMLIEPSNLLRNEIRFMKRDSCKKYAFDRVGQMLNSFDQWEYIYSNFFKTKMLHKVSEGIQLEIPFATDLRIIIETEIKQSKRGLFNRVLAHYGLPTLLNHMSVESLLSLFAEHYNRSQLNQLKNYIDTTIKTSPAFRNESPKANNTGTLISEINHHFINPQFIKSAV
jgi:hypothetical protein